MKYIFLIILPFMMKHIPSEQRAFNYFAKEVMPKNYSNFKYIYISGHTEAEKTLNGIFSKCPNYNNFALDYYKHQQATINELPIVYDGIAGFRKSAKTKKGSLNLNIYRSIENNGFAYTYLKVYKINQFVHHYLIKSDLNSEEVIDVCLVKENI